MSSIESIVSREYNFNLGQYLGRGFEIFKAFALPFVGFTLLVIVISATLSFILPPPLGSGEDGGGGNLVSNILSPILMAGYYIVAFQIARNRPASFSDFFKGFNRNRFLPIFLLSLVSGLLTLLGVVLLIIPGLYLAVSYVFGLPLLLDKGIDFWPALETSRKLITKKWFSFFIFMIVLVIINFAGILLVGLGLLVTIPWSICSIVAAYEDIVGLNSVADASL